MPGSQDDFRRWSSPAPASRESRLRRYERALAAVGLLPLHGLEILDVGCGNGQWLQTCCSRWGADPRSCFGVDLLEEGINEWRRENMKSRITLLCRPAHELPLPDHRFDLVHQSMMFSSILDPALRGRTAAELWRVLRPGGHLVWYDFWINPVNPKTVPMSLRQVRTLFPEAALVYRRRITLAPPLARLISRICDAAVPVFESLRLLNAHHLIVLRKDGPR